MFAYSNLANTSDWTRHFSLRNACCSCVIRTLEEITHVFCYPFLFYGIWAKPYLKNTVHHKNSFTIMNLFLSFFSAICIKVGFFPSFEKVTVYILAWFMLSYNSFKRGTCIPTLSVPLGFVCLCLRSFFFLFWHSPSQYSHKSFSFHIHHFREVNLFYYFFKEIQFLINLRNITYESG